MGRKLLTEERSELFSPLIDVVFNALAATFIIFVVYTLFAIPQTPPPIELLETENINATALNEFHLGVPTIGGTGMRKYEIISGTLPNGLEFDSNQGLIYGIPNITNQQKNSFDFSVSVTDSITADTQEYTINIHSAYLPYSAYYAKSNFYRTKEVLPNGYIKQDYEAVIGAFGGLAPYKWNIISGTLPNGLHLENGKIKGIPTEEGEFIFQVELKDNPRTLKTTSGSSWEWEYQKHTKSFTLNVFPPLPKLEGEIEMPIGRVGEPYLGFSSINTGLSDKKVEFETDAQGLNISKKSGFISGVPTSSGEYNVALNVKNATNDSLSLSKSLTVLPKKPNPLIPTLSLIAFIDENIDYFLPYQGLTEPVKWELKDNEKLPNGLKLESNKITGPPSETGSFNVELSITDALGKTFNKPISIKIYTGYKPLNLLTSEIPNPIVNNNFEFAFSAEGGSGKYDWELNGSLPNGLNFSSPTISGVPISTERTSLSVIVKDLVTKEQRSKNYVIAPQLITIDTIIKIDSVFIKDSMPLSIVTSVIPAIPLSKPFSFAFAAQGGIGAYHWNFSEANTLPENLVFTNNGIQGQIDSLKENKTWEITATVLDDSGQVSETKTFELDFITPSDIKQNIFSDIVKFCGGKKWIPIVILVLVFFITVIWGIIILEDYDFNSGGENFQGISLIIIGLTALIFLVGIIIS